jgi:hypothetical protein
MSHIFLTLDDRTAGAIDNARGDHSSRQQWIRDAIAMRLAHEHPGVISYATWCQLQRIEHEGGSVIPQLVIDRTESSRGAGAQ